MKGSNSWWIHQASGSNITCGPFQVPIVVCLTSGIQSPYRDGDTKGKIGERCRGRQGQSIQMLNIQQSGQSTLIGNRSLKPKYPSSQQDDCKAPLRRQRRPGSYPLWTLSLFPPAILQKSSQWSAGRNPLWIPKSPRRHWSRKET